MLAASRPAISFLVTGVAITVSCLPSMAQARGRGYDIPAQSAASGIRAFARQSDIQILIADDGVRDRSTRAVHGRMHAGQALERLLAGTGIRILSFDGSVAVLEAAAIAPTPIASADPIIVTGSRITQSQAQSAMPVRVVPMADAGRFGRSSVYDMLVREPAVAAGIGLGNAFGQGWDAGISSVSLRGLGTNRSLTLIDGMRRVSGSARSSAVDITMVPAAMIDRMEIITGGATAIYGADAVTGAVNIITRKHVEGFNLSATQGLSQRGDAGESILSFSTGTRFAQDRGSIAIGGTWSRIASLDYAQRYASYIRSIANPANSGAHDNIPDQITIPDFRQIYFAYQPSFYFNGQSYIVENGSPRPAAYEQNYYPGHFSYGNGGDGRNLRDADQLRGGLDALAVMARADYALNDRLTYRAYADFGASDYHGTASFPLHRDDSRSTWFNGAGGSVAYLDNPFLPDGVRQFMLANGLSRLDIERTYGNFPVMRELHDRRALTIGQRVEGDAGGTLRWSAFLQYGGTVDNVRTTSIPRTSRWLAARDVVADPLTGAPVCRDLAARAAGCVPLDIFSEAAPSQALRDYVLGTRSERRVNTQTIWGGDMSGSPVILPHGPMQMVLGFEHRRETLHTRDDPLAASEYTYGGSGYTVHPALDAAFGVSEIYAEAKAPLLANRRFIRSLNVEAAYRYSRYSSVGATGTWKLGSTWSPASGIMVRLMRSHSVRAPNFGELYEIPISRQTGSITDPCEAADYYLSGTRSANCRALGILVPLGDFKIGPIVTTQGNRALRPETSNSLTLGMVLRPSFLPGTELTLDYWDIDIRDAITQFDYTTILNLCVDLPTIDNIFCKAVSRSPDDGRVMTISTNQVNAARLTARGIDFGLSYRRPAASGQMRVEINGTYMLRHMVESTPGVVTGDVRYDGDWEHPRLQGTAQAIWDKGRLSMAASLRFIGSSRYVINAESDEVLDRNALPAFLYADLSLGYRVKDGVSALLGVRNLTNLKPPAVYPVYKDSSIYDQVGRYIFASVTMTY